MGSCTTVNKYRPGGACKPWTTANFLPFSRASLLMTKRVLMGILVQSRWWTFRWWEVFTSISCHNTPGTSRFLLQRLELDMLHSNSDNCTDGSSSFCPIEWWAQKIGRYSNVGTLGSFLRVLCRAQLATKCCGMGCWRFVVYVLLPTLDSCSFTGVRQPNMWCSDDYFARSGSRNCNCHSTEDSLVWLKSFKNILVAANGSKWEWATSGQWRDTLFESANVAVGCTDFGRSSKRNWENGHHYVMHDFNLLKQLISRTTNEL